MGVLAACRIAKRFCNPQKNPRMDFLVLDNKVESPWMGGLATQRFAGQISDPGKNPRMDFFPGSPTRDCKGRWLKIASMQFLTMSFL